MAWTLLKMNENGGNINRGLQDEQPLQLDHARMALLPSGTLTIAAATLSDRATYRCRLENEAERRESRDAQLKINLDMGECAFRQIKQTNQRPNALKG